MKNVMIALGIGLIPGYARVMCAQTLSIKENEYVIAGRAIGASNPRIMFRHILPNSFPPLIVMMTMMLGMAILAEAGLSFLGIGIQPPGQPGALWSVTDINIEYESDTFICTWYCHHDCCLLIQYDWRRTERRSRSKASGYIVASEIQKSSRTVPCS